jgi:uncharacterized protein YcfJ
LFLVKSRKMDLEAAKTATVDSMEVAMEKQRVIDSMQVETKVETQKETIIVNQPENNTHHHHDNTQQKERLSSTAKGAVIGAGVGAATGAIISKKKSTGSYNRWCSWSRNYAGTGAIIDEVRNS